jgi:hypothetical protein
MMVILLMDLESMHIIQLSYFFGLNTVGTVHGLKLSLTKPFIQQFLDLILELLIFLRCQPV